MTEQQIINIDGMCRTLWDNQNAWCQTSLIDDLIGHEVEGFSHEEIENLYFGDEEEPQDILEWWLVDNWFADLLDKQCQPLLRNAYGTWWGRCTSGQVVYGDRVIEDIVRRLYKKEQRT